MQDMEVKRLAFIRYLYKVGVEQSNQPEPLNAVSLLSFHDAAELFLHLAAEHCKVTTKDIKFMDYWDKIDQNIPSGQITQKGPMRRLSEARAQLKHHGTAPSKLDMEAFRATVTNFFQENTPKVFGIGFDSVSLVDLVAYDGAKSKLRSAQNLIQSGDAKRAIQDVAESFVLLIDEYEQETISEFGSSPFSFGPVMAFETSTMDVEGRMKDFVDKVNKSITSMQYAIKIIGLGFDYRKFSKFESLTPTVLMHEYGTDGRNPLYDIYVEEPPSQVTLEDCRFCLDYVIECAIRLQDFDYNR